VTARRLSLDEALRRCRLELVNGDGDGVPLGPQDIPVRLSVVGGKTYIRARGLATDGQKVVAVARVEIHEWNCTTVGSPESRSILG
jgi:hypothetical protein